jgi:hypothetical protein
MSCRCFAVGVGTRLPLEDFGTGDWLQAGGWAKHWQASGTQIVEIRVPSCVSENGESAGVDAVE